MGPIRLILVAILMLSTCHVTHGWEWSDLSNVEDAEIPTDTLSMEEVRAMRVREIKRRLARNHGYSADELGRMLDKKELIHTLSFEEHKLYEKERGKAQRALTIRGIYVAVAAVVLVMGWPIWKHFYDTASINLVVYMDKKRHEASRCIELSSAQGMLGVFLMGVLDILQMWLSVTVLLSWFMSSQYFFPTPNLPVRPAQFMGEKVANGPLASVGLNIGPMALTWIFRFVYGKCEAFTGRALSRAHQQQKKEAREWESPEARAERKAARKAAKKAAREEAELKRRQASEEEAKRRKEAAAQATAQLFPTGMSNGDTTEKPQELEDGEDQSQREFEQQVETLDMEDLD